jgi:hypothetical protein
MLRRVLTRDNLMIFLCLLLLSSGFLVKFGYRLAAEREQSAKTSDARSQLAEVDQSYQKGDYAACQTTLARIRQVASENNDVSLLNDIQSLYTKVNKAADPEIKAAIHGMEQFTHTPKDASVDVAHDQNAMLQTTTKDGVFPRADGTGLFKLRFTNHYHEPVAAVRIKGTLAIADNIVGAEDRRFGSMKKKSISVEQLVIAYVLPGQTDEKEVAIKVGDLQEILARHANEFSLTLKAVEAFTFPIDLEKANQFMESKARYCRATNKPLPELLQAYKEACDEIIRMETMRLDPYHSQISPSLRPSLPNIQKNR